MSTITIANTRSMPPRKNTLSDQLKARLPAIAPRHESASKESLHSPQKGNGVSKSSPARLPPRSKFGCWTCRTRKVKCDEDRPKCTPCARLGHPCDYRPRLSFKDDTPRVLEKMRPYTGDGFSLWSDSCPQPQTQVAVCRPEDDNLPPFSQLTTDEDRERKAEFRIPGTYHIVVNLSSFASSTGSDDEAEDVKSPSIVSPKTPRKHSTAQRRPPKKDCFEDPDTMILGSFEESIRGLPSLVLNPQSGLSDTPSVESHSPFPYPQSIELIRYHSEPRSLMDMMHVRSSDRHIVVFYNNFVRRQFNQVHQDTLGNYAQSGSMTVTEVLDQIATSFIPLYHAVMAFSALSMAHSQGIQNLKALQHYQEALPSLKNSLKSSQDLSSDGALLTHLMLLLYEIAGAEPRGSNLWAQHLRQLHRIITVRRSLYGPESHGFVVWWVFAIDTHSVLCGSGRGEYVEAMLNSDLLPPVNPPLPSPGTATRLRLSNGRTSSDLHAAPSMLEFHRIILVQAARFGLLSRDIRNEVAQSPQAGPSYHRRQQVEDLRRHLAQTYRAYLPRSQDVDCPDPLLPLASRGISEHTYALYRACMIYSHTSMWSTQRLEMTPEESETVSQAAREIRQLALEISEQGFIERKFIVFPLFMAGIASRAAPEQELVLELISVFEQQSIGKVMAATRQLLGVVFERQRASMGMGMDAFAVDWIDTVSERGLQMIDARL